MDLRTIRYSELPGTSRLFLDYLYDPVKTHDFYDHSPWDAASYAATAAAVDYPDERRRSLVDALRAQNGEHPLVDLLARPGTFVVATGQQVGLFGGPAYTVYKALTAAKLARRLTDLGLPAVPVFWLATEDHDFAEVNHCWVFDGDHRPGRIEAGGEVPSQSPVGPLPVREGAAGELRQALGALPFGGQVAAAVEEAYVAGSTFGGAFQDLMKKLLAPYPLLFLDPLQPPIRQLAAPLLSAALERSSELVPLVVKQNQALEAAGYHAQVHVDAQSSMLFLLDGGLRIPLRAAGGAYRCGDRQVSTPELLRRAADLSPNALLRPVVQDYILPTLATVMGPAEVAYMAQAQVLYRELRLRTPVVVPRAGFTVLDSRSARLVDRYGLSLPDVWRGEDALRERIARSLIPSELERSINQTKSETGEGIARLRADLMSFDPTLAEATERSRRKILHQFGKIEGKVAREALRRSERAGAEAALLSRLICPQRHLQERFYSILPFLAKHGLDLIDKLYQDVDLDGRDHRVLVA